MTASAVWWAFWLGIGVGAACAGFADAVRRRWLAVLLGALTGLLGALVVSLVIL